MKILSVFLIFALSAFANEPQALPQVPNITIQPTTQTQQTQPTSENNSTKPTRNPFESVMTPKQSGQISNPPKLNLFTKTTLNLPSSARKIKKITLSYQNLDGSISTMEQELDGDIDWHFPLVLSQEVQANTALPTFSDFDFHDTFAFHIDKKNLTLKTPLKLIRDFTLASPTRLILDFKSNSKQNLKDSITTNLPVINGVKLQTHLDFYRITLNLDGQYKYSLKPTKEGLEIAFY